MSYDGIHPSVIAFGTNDMEIIYPDHKFRPTFRYVTLGELRMEEFLLDEQYKTIYCENVWDVDVPGYPVKKVYSINTYATYYMGGNGNTKDFVAVTRIDNPRYSPLKEHIFITDEFASPTDLADAVDGVVYSVGSAAYPSTTRPGWGVSNIVAMGDSITMGGNYRSYRPQKPRNRKENKAKWKNQNKPYHQR